MKVFIGKYKNWFGVYDVVYHLKKIGVSQDNCDKIADWLSEHTPMDKWLTWVYENLCKRKVKIRIDKYDTWNMDHTLALIILPMLKQLKEYKHGSPLVEDEDVPSRLRYGDPNGDDNWVHYKWEYVLDEMIWAFEQELDDEWEDRFVHGEPRIVWEDIEGSEYKEMKQVNPDYWVDREGIKLHNDRMNNGFRLFGKYYRGLWA